MSEVPQPCSDLSPKPLCQGVPSRFIVQEMALKGDVEAVILSQLKV